MRPWILAETNYAITQENPYEVAVIPLGATEPHNLHLPYGTEPTGSFVINIDPMESSPAKISDEEIDEPEQMSGVSPKGHQLFLHF